MSGLRRTGDLRSRDKSSSMFDRFSMSARRAEFSAACQAHDLQREEKVSRCSRNETQALLLYPSCNVDEGMMGNCAFALTASRKCDPETCNAEELKAFFASVIKIRLASPIGLILFPTKNPPPQSMSGVSGPTSYSNNTNRCFTGIRPCTRFKPQPCWLPCAVLPYDSLLGFFVYVVLRKNSIAPVDHEKCAFIDLFLFCPSHIGPCRCRPLIPSRLCVEPAKKIMGPCLSGTKVLWLNVQIFSRIESIDFLNRTDVH